MTNINIEVTESARKTITNMVDEIHRLKFELGEDSPKYIKAAGSLAVSFGRMLCMPGLEKISSDGSLDLYCTTESIVFGVNYTGSSMDADGAGSWSLNS